MEITIRKAVKHRLELVCCLCER